MSDPTERAIFLQAIDEDDLDDRLAYLDSACGDDLALRASVEALLAAHDRPARLLDHPLGSGVSRTPRTPSCGDEPIDHIGMQIGPYKLMEQIGEGGFGLVFVAEQERPVRRRVALKIVKPGAGSKEVIARFEAERQAVAMMTHPNIAQVFDAGVTADHRPYFVMELVRGLPITEFCDQQRLDVRRRLDLMLDVCSAVHHAHQKGVIHRDLKPSNILVTLHDGKPVAKVIDFGVAKALDQKLTDKTVYTRFFSMIGTPLYMSPEQAEMSGLDVDTRSDIYSLGVVLYELLAGTTPFDSHRLDSAGLDELRRIIREEEPPRPSNRVSTQDRARSTIVDQRRIEPQRLASTLRGDLDWIVMKSLEKDRSRRYDSAAALANDIRCYLNGEPINARPPSAVYQFQKFARRHRVAILTATLVLLTMVAGTAVSVWQMSEAIGERNAKDAALREATQAKADAIAARERLEEFTDNLIQANELVASGLAHADAGRWVKAARDYDAAVEMQPNYYLPRVQRAQLYTRLLLWPEAAEEYAMALNSGALTSQPHWWGVPALFLYTGHDDGFARLSAQYRRQLDEPTPNPRWMSVRWLVVSDQHSPHVDFRRLADLTDAWLERRQPLPPFHPNSPRGQPRRIPGGPFGRRLPPPENSPMGMSLYVAGLASLRAGDFESALERLSLAAADHRWPGNYLVHAPMALACERLGDRAQAKQVLERSEERIVAILAEAQDDPQHRLASPWFDVIEALQMHHEAGEQIGQGSSALNDQLDQIRTASLSLIDPERPQPEQ